jgi:SAM-dependent methyltransferase
MSGQMPDSSERAGEREREFWDEHVPPLERLLARYARGPEPNTRAMLDAVEPLQGMRVLDFACGAGLTANFLAQRGARVTAIDISPASVARTGELAAETGNVIELIAGELRPGTFAPASFDAVVGRYALHHVELRMIAPILNEVLVPGGRGSFLETMGLNPLLNIARARIAGRAGVASYGSDDERPLNRGDLRVLREAFGSVELSVGELRFLRIFDRNVLRYGRPGLAHALGRVDDGLARLGLGVLSYHQIVKVTKRPQR